MHRRTKSNIKTGIIISVFTIFVTLLFLVSVGTLSQTLIKDNDDNSGVYVLSTEDYKSILEDNGKLQMDTQRIKDSSHLLLFDLNKLGDYLVPVCIIFMIGLIILLLCLWFVLKSFQNKKILKIAEEMKMVTDEKVLSEEPILTTTYEILKYRFDSQLNDYKRLNAYLTHEQKNSLAILRTNLELSENRDYLNIIDDIADSIDDILTLSENNDDQSLVPVDVLLLCAKVHDHYSKLSKTISFDFDEEDTEIMAKSRWIYRAVANLLDNAIKYGEGKPIELSVRVKKGSVIVIVKDHGIGIDRDKQDLIFNDHYRINELNKDGYGIGLSLVSHVCDLCGGFVMVESELGIGSSFYVSFPRIL